MARIGVPLLLIVLLMPVGWVRRHVSLLEVAGDLFLLILLTSVLTVIAMFGEWMERIRIEESKYPRCQHCNYNLTSLKSGDKCPECGEMIEFAPCQWW